MLRDILEGFKIPTPFSAGRILQFGCNPHEPGVASKAIHGLRTSMLRLF